MRNKKRQLPMRAEALGFRGPQSAQGPDWAGPMRVWRGGRKMARRRLAQNGAERMIAPPKSCKQDPRRAGGSCSGEKRTSLGGPCRGVRTKARLLPIARRQIRPVAVGRKESPIGSDPSRGGSQPEVGQLYFSSTGRSVLPCCKAEKRRDGHALGRAEKKTPQPAGNSSPDRRSRASPLPSSCRSPQPVRRTSRARLSISSTTAG